MGKPPKIRIIINDRPPRGPLPPDQLPRGPLPPDQPCGELEVNEFFMEMRVRLKLGGCIKAGQETEKFIDKALVVNECIEETIKIKKEDDCEAVMKTCKPKWDDIEKQVNELLKTMQIPIIDCDDKGVENFKFKKLLKELLVSFNKTNKTDGDSPLDLDLCKEENWYSTRIKEL